MFPIRDVNPSLTRPWLNWAIIASAIYVFFFLQPSDPVGSQEFAYRHAAIPCELTTGETLSIEEIRNGECSADPSERPVFPAKSVFTSLVVTMLLHGSLLHLLGNMWSLWIFGNNIEDAYGHFGYLALYLLAGLAASLGHVFLRPDSVIPVVGASGAIAGVMGSYLVLFPRSSVVTVIPIFLFPWVVEVPAVVFLGIWFLGQFLLAGGVTNIAWEAHVAGFLFGLVATLVLQGPLRRRIRAHRARLISAPGLPGY